MQWINGLIKKFSDFEKRLGNISLLISVRRGLTLMIPVVLIGSFALLLTSLPIPAYQNFMAHSFGSCWKSVFIYIHDGTTNILSLVMVVCISYSYSIDYSEKYGCHVSPVITAIVSLCSFAALFGITKKDFSILNYGVLGAFVAIVVAVTSSMLFLKLSSVKALRIKPFSDGDNAVFHYALAAVFPAAITIAVYAVINETLIAVFGIYDIRNFLTSFFCGFFTKTYSQFLSAVLFMLLIHLFWALGIHGSNVLEPVAQSIFVPALTLNQQLISSGKAPTQIFTKTFFDTFVLMGGCGAALCLILAIFITERHKNQLRIAKLSIVPVVFNINELIIFGIPIVLNPIYIIPFLCVPVILTLTSFLAMSWGLVPFTSHLVEWTTPVFLSGYVSTGSVSGSLLQLFNLALGTLCYIPFVKLAGAVSDSQVKNNITKLYTKFKQSEERGLASDLLSRQDDIGSISRFLAADLLNDIKNNSISLYYQPQVDYDGKVFCSEALLRWNHRTYGFIYPPLIIALAEESHFIDKLGYFILDTACGDLKKMGRLGLQSLSVSVNISAVQLENEHFIDDLKEIIKKHQINPNLLNIEITEQIALAKSKKIVEQILSIKKLGVHLEMDDFGMGHSSLMYLKEYNFDSVKLDGSLVREICENNNCSNIISSIVYLSKSLNYKVIAEFVETEEQRELLHSLGCDRYQGYYFSKAVPFRELIEYINGREYGETQTENIIKLK